MIGTHEPHFYESKDAQTMIIFIHGFMGSPSQFEQLISACETLGYSVSAILLPGHGGTINDLCKSGYRVWKAYAQEHISRMSKKYRNIILVGHSMGSLLGFSLCREYSDTIKGIVAIATPIRILIKPQAIKTSWSVMRGKVKEDDLRTKAAHEFCSVGRASIWAYIKSTPRFLDVFKLILSTRREISQIEVPTLLIHSVDDEVANIYSLRVLKKKLKRADTLKLYNSGHNYYSEQDTDLIIEKTKYFLNRLSFES